MPHCEGDVLQGRYQVLAALKTGGMGAVYRAADLQFADRGVLALKEMLSDFSDPTTQELIRTKFKEEARTLVSLAHPGIPRVWDHFVDGDVHYIVMEFIEGDSLEQVLEDSLGLAKAPLGPKLVVEIAIQLCQILEYIHNRPGGTIMHRDIKPANVILRRGSREVVLVDFGLARTFNADSLSPKTSVGTLGYAPMEQLKGHPEPGSDIFGVGATMYHLLSGARPKPFERLRLEEVMPSAPAPLRDVVNRALEEDPRDRYPSATEMKVALQEILPLVGDVAPEPEVPLPERERSSEAGGSMGRDGPSSSWVRALERVPPRARRPAAAVLGVGLCALLVLAWMGLRPPPLQAMFELPGQAAGWRMAGQSGARFEGGALVLEVSEYGTSPFAWVDLQAREGAVAASGVSFHLRRSGNPTFTLVLDGLAVHSIDSESGYTSSVMRVTGLGSGNSPLRELQMDPLSGASPVALAHGQGPEEEVFVLRRAGEKVRLEVSRPGASSPSSSEVVPPAPLTAFQRMVFKLEKGSSQATARARVSAFRIEP